MAAEARHAVAAAHEAAGDYRAAVEALEPLRSTGDNEAAEKLKDLYPLAAQQPAGPIRIPCPAASRRRRCRAAGLDDARGVPRLRARARPLRSDARCPRIACKGCSTRRRCS